MKRLTLFATALFVAVSSFATITYELNGGVTNDWGWTCPQDMYETLNADWNKFSGSTTTWTPLEALKAKYPGDFEAAATKGIPTEASAMKPEFIADATFLSHFAWLLEHFETEYAAAKDGASFAAMLSASGGGALLRYTLSCFFFNTTMGDYKCPNDFANAGVDTYSAYARYWKTSFNNPTNPTDSVALYPPFKEGFSLYGWYDNAEFTGKPITHVSAETTATKLYAKWIETPWLDYYKYLGGDSVMVIKNQHKGDVIIPDVLNNTNGEIFRVVGIADHAFEKCDSIKSVTLGKNITKIGSSAFKGCSNLTAITIPNSVTFIGEDAFCGCNIRTFKCTSTQLDETSISNNSYILEYAQLDTIVAPAGFFDLSETYWSSLAKSIRYVEVNGGELTADAFAVINRSYKMLTHLDLAGTTNTEIADEAFKGCYKLETLLLPAQLERIGYMAVADCKMLKSIDIPATVIDIDDSAFENCRSIETLTFGGKQPAGKPAFISEEDAQKGVSTSSALQRIGNWAFYNCHELQHLEIPEGVTEIGAAAFYGCTYLEDLTLPASVQSIGDNCFALCSKLNKITCLATVPPMIEAKTFYDVDRSIPLYVPEANINDYANDTYWGEFINPVAAENDSTTNISSITANEGIITRKVFENGTIYILRNGEKYTIDGRKVSTM